MAIQDRGPSRGPPDPDGTTTGASLGATSVVTSGSVGTALVRVEDQIAIRTDAAAAARVPGSTPGSDGQPSLPVLQNTGAAQDAWIRATRVDFAEPAAEPRTRQ